MIKVLVVEDEPKIVDMERDFLEGSGYQPYVASDGKEALKSWMKSRSMPSSWTSCFREKTDSLCAAK